MFIYVKRFCYCIEILVLYNFYVVIRYWVEEVFIELVDVCKFLKVFCIWGINVFLRIEFVYMVNKVKNCVKRNDIEILRRFYFLLFGVKLCLDSVVKNLIFLMWKFEDYVCSFYMICWCLNCFGGCWKVE